MSAPHTPVPPVPINLHELKFLKAEDHNTQALVAWSEKRLRRAIIHLNYAIYLTPLEPSYYIHKAEIYLISGDLTSAIANLTRASQLCKKSTFLRAKLALVYQIQGQVFFDQRSFRKALDMFQLSMNEFPASHRVRLLMVLSNIGLEEFETAFILLSELIKLEPSHEDLYVLRAKLYLMKNKVKSAFDDLNTAGELTNHTHPEIPLIKKQIVSMAMNYKNMASEEYNRGHVKAACDLLSKALAVHPFDCGAHLQRACVLRELKRYDEAIADLEWLSKNFSLEKDPRQRRELSKTLTEYAMDLMHNGDHKKANVYLTAAIDATPDNLSLYRLRSDCRVLLNKFSQALDDMEKLVRHDPKNSAYRRACSVILAQMALATRNPHEAVKFYGEAIQYDPNNANLFVGRAKAYIHDSDWTSAHDDILRALSIDASNADARTVLTQIESRSFPFIMDQEALWHVQDTKRGDGWLGITGSPKLEDLCHRQWIERRKSVNVKRQ